MIALLSITSILEEGREMTQRINQAVHVRFDGRSEELTLAMLDLASNASDIQIRQALTSHFDLPANYLDTHVIVRTNQAVIVRPEAMYG
jgi:hypothetical protein